jgi:hypothetical protein
MQAGSMLRERMKLVQCAAAGALFACLLSPLCEILLRSDSSIFASGRDTESTLALVLLVIQLSFAIAKLLVAVLRAVFTRVGMIGAGGVARIAPVTFTVAAASSPPVLSLRI